MNKQTNPVKKIRDDYFDFSDLIKLLSKTKYNAGHTISDIFEKIMDPFLDEAERMSGQAFSRPESLKNMRDGILYHKQKNFNVHIRHAIESIGNADTLVKLYPMNLSRYFENTHPLCQHILFLAREDKLVFNDDDIHYLEDNVNNPNLFLCICIFHSIAHYGLTYPYGHSKDYNYDRAIESKTVSEPDIKWTTFAEYPSFAPFFALNDFQRKDDSIMTSMSQSFNNNLLSKGYIRSSAIKHPHSVISSDTTNNSQKIKPLQNFVNCQKSLLVIGDGGIGKTTFLKSILQSDHKRMLPIYVSLSSCKTTMDSEHMIQSKLLTEIQHYTSYANLTFSEMQQALTYNKNELPKIVLLLDGFNELTLSQLGTIRQNISSEINMLLQYSNIRIIMTSRQSDFYGLDETQFDTIQAIGLTSSDICTFLRQNANYSDAQIAEIKAQETLLQLLHIPLFLTMYIHISDTNTRVLQSRGAILHAFFGKTDSFYTERTNIRKKTDNLILAQISFTIDFILPVIGFAMNQRDLFQLAPTAFCQLVEKAKQRAQFFSNLDIYKKYNNPYSLSHICKIMDSLCGDDLFHFAKSIISVLNEDNDGCYYFCHQYIRDYFSALYCIQDLYLFTNNRNILSLSSLELPSCCNLFWSDEQKNLVNGILSYENVEFSKDLIYEALCALKPMSAETTHSLGIYCIPNLISTMVQKNEGNLSAYDFSNLDLRNVSLSNINFHNPISNESSDFSDSLIGSNTFSSDGHSATLMDWVLSDDGLYILSLSVSNEIKVFDIETGYCLHTATVNYAPQHDYKIVHLSLHKNGTYAVISYSYQDDLDIICNLFGYNFMTNCQIYFYPPEDAFNFTYVGYDENTHKVYAITDNNAFYRFELTGQECPNYPIVFSDTFAQRLDKDLLKEQKRKFHYALKRVSLLKNNKLLYIEADAFYPYVHAIDDEIYDYYSTYNYVKAAANVNLAQRHKEVLTHDINYFIYDLKSKEFHALQLDCTPNEMTTLALRASSDDDIITTHTAISHDGQYICIHNQNDIFVYDAEINDFLFRTICALPHNANYSLHFVSPNPKILTLICQGNILLLNHQTGQLLTERLTPMPNNMYDYEYITNKYTILEASHPSFGKLRVFNYLDDSEHGIQMYNNTNICNMFFDETLNCLIAVYENSAVITYDPRTLDTIESYNFAYNSTTLSATYDIEAHRMYLLISKSPAFLYADDIYIMHIDMNTWQSVKANYYFSDRLLLSLTDSSTFIAAADNTAVYLIETNTLSIVSKTIYNNKSFEYSPVKLFFEDNHLIIIYSNYNFESDIEADTLMNYFEIKNGTLIQCAYLSLPTININDAPALLVEPCPRTNIGRVTGRYDLLPEDFVTYYTDTGEKILPGDLPWTDDSRWVCIYDQYNPYMWTDYQTFRPCDIQLLAQINADHYIVLCDNKCFFATYKFEGENFAVNTGEPFPFETISTITSDNHTVIYIHEDYPPRLKRYSIESRDQTTEVIPTPNQLTAQCPF